MDRKKPFIPAHWPKPISYAIIMGFFSLAIGGIATLGAKYDIRFLETLGKTLFVICALIILLLGIFGAAELIDTYNKRKKGK